MPSFTLVSFHPSKFVFCSCVLAFSIFVALRCDGIVNWDYWVVAIPLFFLDALVFVGAAVGITVWRRRQDLRDEQGKKDFQSMLTTAFLFIFVTVFEALVCHNLQDGVEQIHWSIVFIPLYLLSIASIVVIVINKRFNQNAEVSSFFSVGLLFYIFLPLKVSGAVSWTWEAVFSPLWILFCILALVQLYYTILFLFSLCSTDASFDDRVSLGASTVGTLLILAPTLTFAILLVMRLDGLIDTQYVVINVPFMVTLSFLIWTSMVKGGGNPWWFGRVLLEEPIRRHLPRIGQVSFSGSSYHPRTESQAVSTNAVDEESRLAQGDVDDDTDSIWSNTDIKVAPYISILTPD